MRSPAHYFAIKAYRQQQDRADKAGRRSVFTRARKLEAGVDASLLTVRSSEIIVNSEGKFYFMVGFSRVGGDDVVG